MLLGDTNLMVQIETDFTTYGEECTFDFIIKKHKLNDPGLDQLALIVRGADTDRLDLAAQSAGLWAITAGLSYNYKDDHQMLETGMKIYAALYSWAKYVQQERHNWNSI